MSPPPTTAVILAAGLGSRLRGFHDDPKGLLLLGGHGLVPRIIDAVRAAGLTRIVLVTGYRAERYADLVRQESPLVRSVHNPDFARTGSMHSLWLARQAVEGDVLLIESDLLFEPRALDALLSAPRRTAILLSGATGQGDEVHALGTAGRLHALTKKLSPGQVAAGEFVGVARLTAGFFQTLCTHYATRVTFPSNYHYDDGLTALAADHPIHLTLVPDLLWAEIDTAAQHERALRVVLPRLPPSHAGAP